MERPQGRWIRRERRAAIARLALETVALPVMASETGRSTRRFWFPARRCLPISAQHVVPLPGRSLRFRSRHPRARRNSCRLAANF